MSDHVVQSHNDSDGTARESPHLYQSAWMAHWKHTSYNPETPVHDRREDGDSKQVVHEIPSHIIKSTKGLREISEPGTVNIMNDSLKLSSVKFENERLESQSFQKFNLSQNRDRFMALRNVTSCHGIVSEMENLSGECHFQLEGITGNPEQPVKSHESIEKKGVAVSTSFDHGSSSKIVPYRYGRGISPQLSVICRQEDVKEPSHLVASKEHITTTKFQSYATSSVHGKKTINPSDFLRSGISSSRQNNQPLLLHDCSASTNELPVFVDRQWEDGQIRSGSRSFPNWASPLDSSRSKTLFHNFHPVSRIPRALHDVGAMRIFSTVDSKEELSGCSPMFSQTTHHFMISKETGDNLSDGGQMFRDSTFSANIKGKMLSKFPGSSSGFRVHGQGGPKLQPLGGFTATEGKDNFGDVRSSAVCLKNESSAETDTMDMDVLQKDCNSGVVSPQTGKFKRGGQISSTSQAGTTPSREETGGRLPNSEIPDINEEFPAAPTPVDDRETSTSRTESLDVDNLLFHAELITTSKSGAFPGSHEEAEPSIRWIKRLKLSTSDSFIHGTKSVKMEEASSHEKVKKLFGKIMRRSITSPEPTVGKCSGKEPMALDQPAILLRNGESPTTETVRKVQDFTLSSPWIRRWCHLSDASPVQNHDALVVCKPQSSNAALDEFGKKQFPSIAAMALMGKALNSFQTCKFRKRGTYIVWNT